MTEMSMDECMRMDMHGYAWTCMYLDVEDEGQDDRDEHRVDADEGSHVPVPHTMHGSMNAPNTCTWGHMQGP